MKPFLHVFRVSELDTYFRFFLLIHGHILEDEEDGLAFETTLNWHFVVAICGVRSIGSLLLVELCNVLFRFEEAHGQEWATFIVKRNLTAVVRTIIYLHLLSH